MNYVLNQQQLDALLNYLSQKPYREVATAMQMLQSLPPAPPAPPAS